MYNFRRRTLQPKYYKKTDEKGWKRITWSLPEASVAPCWHFTWPFEWESLGEHRLWWFIVLTVDFMTLRDNRYSCVMYSGLHLVTKLTELAVNVKSDRAEITATSHSADRRFMVYNLETTLSHPLVELAHLPSHYSELTETWQQEYPTESNGVWTVLH